MKFRTRDAMKIYYYVLIADGMASQTGIKKFLAIGEDMDDKFGGYKNKIIEECEEQARTAYGDIDYYSVIEDGISKLLSNTDKYETRTSDSSEKIGITLFLWDLLDIAMWDHNCSENRTNLVKYIADKLDINESVIFVMSNSIKGIQDIDREIAWLKTTNQPYWKKESTLKELEERQEVIYNSIRELMAENAKKLMVR